MVFARGYRPPPFMNGPGDGLKGMRRTKQAHFAQLNILSSNRKQSPLHSHKDESDQVMQHAVGDMPGRRI